MKTKGQTVLAAFEKICLLTAFICAVVGSGIYLYINVELFNHFALVVSFFVVFLVLMAGAVASSFLFLHENNKKTKILNLVSALLTVAVGVYIIITQLIVDHFQPFSIFAPPIICFALFLLCYGVSGILGFFKTKNTKALSLIALSFAGIVLLNVAWAKTQDYAKFNENVYTNVVFQKGEGDYTTYRIPTLLLLEGEGKDGKDAVAVFAEARCNTARDMSDSEMVYKISLDGGDSFSEIRVALKPSDFLGETGRIADPTPVYNPETKTVSVLFEAGKTSENYRLTSYYMEGKLLENGEILWDKEHIVNVTEKTGLNPGAGPAKGVCLADGTLAFPVRCNGSNAVLKTKDGSSFTMGESIADGAEADLDTFSENEIFMVLRSGSMASFPRNAHLRFAYSNDNGETFAKPAYESTLRTPSVQSSVACYDGKIYCAYADSYKVRANLSYAVSEDKGETFKTVPLYSGASGYAIGDIAKDGTYYIIAEIGKVEYNDELRLFRCNVNEQ